ncbi:6-carboxytetrahydropterin synthase [Algoriphagus sp. CAU 1675]|uniref:6-pyruvoyl trahydropterin synthase family protein n=1 Tax=Algoriphagus sp. CAU 1675 TaxID=3032597 RepID=UPI0023DC0247|nr:6-carboxytetrahydropterin synthase [Algoriphagus sp. CAU 1675]MDF2156509.1 6-carboxytetrahydropterin synthase [Algoriphagus sp. CAU 1675]
MITLTKKFEFEAAHRISNYEGPCLEIHGHTYKLEVTISGPIDPVTDMILDFKTFKNLVKKSIIEQFDHALLLKDNEENRKLFEGYAGKIAWMNSEPTAERMLQGMADTLQRLISAPAQLDSLLLYETSSSFACWKNSIG